MAAPPPPPPDYSKKQGVWYNGGFYEFHPTKAGYFLCEGKEFWCPKGGGIHPVPEDATTENGRGIVTEAAKNSTGQDFRDINQYATLGWARLVDLARLDEPSLVILDEGIRSIRKSILDNYDPSSGSWVECHVHPQLLALFHRLDIRYDDGRLDMDQSGGWARYADKVLSVDARILGAVSSRRKKCNNSGAWASTAAMDTLLEISRWRKILD